MKIGWEMSIFFNLLLLTLISAIVLFRQMIWEITKSKGGSVIRKPARLTVCILYSIAILAACAKSPQAPEVVATPTSIDMIQPGDTVNGVLVTTGNEDSTFIFDLPCTKKDGIDICTVTLGYPCNVIGSIAAPTPEELEETWQTYTETFSIEGRPVDLGAFGTIDFVHDRTQLYMRAPNVVLTSTEPVTLTFHDILTVGGGTTEYTYLVAFKPEVEDPIQPLSTAVDRLGQHPYTSETTNFELLLYLPGEYGKDPQQTWPLILFLHAFPNVTKLDWMRIKPIAVRLDNQLEFPFIVASPLHAGEKDHWSQPEVVDDLLTLLAELQADFNINPKQIYLSGIIEGANGAWELGLAHPELFAALAPVGGYMGYPFAVPENICDLKDMPIWAFHGEDDTVIPLNAEQMLVDALKACGSNAIQFTTYPDASYEIYLTVFENQNLYTWLLEQSK
jgi:hypothetical protein